MMSAPRDPARLRAGLNPILTASIVGYPQNPGNTPISALSIGSHGAFSSAQTPISAIQPYNPQEWVASPMVSSEPQTPPPPPPYSPPRSGPPLGTPGTAADPNGTANAPPRPQLQRPAPETPVTTSFPPPPTSRGSSRERRFNFPTLGRKRSPEMNTSPSEQASASRSFSLLGRASNNRPLTLQIPTRPAEPEPASALGPPGARRAASTPAPSTPTSARSRSSSQVRWDPSMPLPPPPPGPPPSAIRSQSVQRVSSGSDPIVSPPTRRPPPSGVSALGPVPPTPANWREGDAMPGPDSTAQAAGGGSTTSETDSTSTATIATTANTTLSTTQPREMPNGAHQIDSAASVSSATSSTLGSGLTRSPAVRGEREKTILERRSESRTRAASRGSVDATARPPQHLSDITIPQQGNGLQRRLTITRGTQRTGRSCDTPQTAESIEQDSTTPRALATHVMTGQVTPTRLSPDAEKQPDNAPQTLAPKALPTPPTGSRASSTVRNLTVDTTTLHSEAVLPMTKQAAISQSTEQFMCGTIERFTAFAQREAEATTDAERVRLFAEFFVSESRIRRERYGAAIAAMGSEIFDLTRDLFRPMPVRRESESATSGTAVDLTPQSSEPRSRGGSFGVHTPASSVQPSPSMGPTNPTPGGWATSTYMPSLSPILSMSVSDALDEEDSRGRPASRWWEAESNGAPSMRIERSKRESKYMGVVKEAREALQWCDDPHSSPRSSQRTSYPPEKTGWHDEKSDSTAKDKSRSSLASSTASVPSTPSPDHLDISRLVTLPPPYPRHHPAVNNNHPELAETRSAVRSLSNMSEVEEIKKRFVEASSKMRAEALEATKKRRQALRQHLQQQISSGNLSYSEAAQIEADAKQEEHTALREMEKRDFEQFQTDVVIPVNEILQTRIAKATELFDSLRNQLFDETAESNPNLPQEEGDEQPELLEKLTLLKWIFEAREALHRALFDLLTDRNDRYRDMVLVPYRLANDTEKIASAEAFFADDTAKRALQFSEESLHRTQEFRDVVEETVSRGVQVQLNAFWDIAPPLKRLLDKIPMSGDLSDFKIQIPPAEFAENPAYHQHPLQYLYSLLLHAEKSTYQFIESQTNLLCLLHEVKEACVRARGVVMERDGRDPARVKEFKQEELRRLTEDLKDKVRVVQEQWNSGLGETMKSVKERVGEYLLETGGWDESFEEGDVGGV